ncbi:hypothetical protein DFQ28_005752 [Apophysomyces sp. BC1034]|nr:hypothetical protein DFQ28_005752 [Apophysomyces sp. BC1034]
MTNDNPNDYFPQSELDLLENAMQNMMHGTMGSLFRQLIDPNVFDSPQSERSITATSTVDDFGGSDFKRLANKSKVARGLIPESPPELSSEVARPVVLDLRPRVDEREAAETFPSLFQLMFSHGLNNDIFQSSSRDDEGITVQPSSVSTLHLVALDMLLKTK